MGDGVDQVGLAQAGVPVDEEGVIVLGRVLGHRLGGGVGQLVAGAHHEGIEGELVVGIEALVPGGLAPQEGTVAVLIQEGDGDVPREEVLQGGLDVLHEEGLDIAPLEIVGAVEEEGAVPEVQGRDLVKPGADSGLRELRAELLEDALPHVRDGIQMETPRFLSWRSWKLGPEDLPPGGFYPIINIPQKRGEDNTYSKYKGMTFPRGKGGKGAGKSRKVVKLWLTPRKKDGILNDASS